MMSLATDQRRAMEHRQALRNAVILGVASIILSIIAHAALSLLAPLLTRLVDAPDFEKQLIVGVRAICGWITILAISTTAIIAAWHALRIRVLGGGVNPR